MTFGHIWALFLVACVATQRQIPQKHVVIIGGGVAGLSTAHVLSREPGLKITVLERHPSAGGHSRSESFVDSQGFNRFYDAGWRVFTDSYDDLFPLLAEIPFDITNPASNNTVRSKLVPMDVAIFVNNTHEDVLYEFRFGGGFSFHRVANLVKYLSDLAFGEIVRVASVIALAVFGSDERLDSFENHTFAELAHADVDPKVRTVLFRGIADGLLPVVFGQNPQVTSANSSLHFLNRVVGTFHSSGGTTYFFPGPPNETVFGPWTRFLEQRNVEIRLNAVADALIHNEDGQVSQIVTTNKKTGKTERLSVDHVVMAAHPRDAAKLLKDVELAALARRSETHFSGLTIFFSKPVVDTKSAYWYVPSPWHIATLTYDGFWDPKFFNFGSNVEVKQVLNLVLCNFEARGVVTNKTMGECTQDEMLTEVLAQMGIPEAEKYVVKFTPSLLNPRNESYDKVPDLEDLGDWTFGHSRLAKNSIPALNHFHSKRVTLAGSWTQFHYTQEGAAESGKLAAKHVLASFGMEPSTPISIGWDQRWEVAWIRDLDRITFRLGLPIEATYATIIGCFFGLFYLVLKSSFDLLSFCGQSKKAA